ncbi:MAG: tRNA pseudouridine(38-40) synthase TruA [Deltaproteobacteria bacterium]|jgi:tRNA pseudouridine38-40 synthase|nr:tRNA pseudouridine(38-40) synthase TruA [Deltaproteobacteria bacterium]
MRILLTIEYLGSAFSGWQRQANAITIQEELERAINIYFNSLAKKTHLLEPISYINLQGSGRTDAGVHARGQTADFLVPAEIKFELGEVLIALNGIVNKNIVIKQLQIVADDFNSRLTPHTKCYSYRLLLRSEHLVLDNGLGWLVGNKLDVKSMLVAAKLFCGKHDFCAFRAADCNSQTTIRTIEQSELVRISDEVLQYFVVGRGFLKQMVRIMVGTLVAVGRRKKTVEEVAELLAKGSELGRAAAGETVPACGLCLEWVKYY